MLDHLFGLLLLGLGVQTPALPQGTVKGEQTEVSVVETEQESEDVKISPTPKPRLAEKENKPRPTVSIKFQKPDDRLNSKVGNATAAAAAKKAVNERVEEKKESVELRREQLKKEIETRKEAAKTEVEQLRKAFSERITTIKDKKKQEIVKNIDKGIAEVNKARTEAMARQLTRMEEILGKKDEFVRQLEAKGQDVSTAKTAITTALSAISSAKNAVVAQAAKEYVIGITTEKDLREMVEKTQTQFETDIKSVQAKVKEARELTAQALNAGVELKKTSTDSEVKGVN